MRLHNPASLEPQLVGAVLGRSPAWIDGGVIEAGDSGHGPAGDCGTQLGIPHGPGEERRELIRPTGSLEDIAVHAMLDDLVSPGVLACHDDAAGSHGLDHGESPAVLPAREEEDVGCRVPRRQLVVSQPADEPHSLADAERRRKRPVRSVAVAADDPQLRSAAAASEPFDRGVEALAPEVVADKERRELVLGNP